MSRSSLAARLQDNRPASGPPRGSDPLPTRLRFNLGTEARGLTPAPGFENAGEFADGWLEPVPLDDQRHPYGKRDGTED